MANWLTRFKERRNARTNKLTKDASTALVSTNLNPPPCSQKDIKRLLYYDPATGDFTWIGHKYKAHNGKLAGCKHKTTKNFYWELKIFGKKYKAHVVAYYYMTGIWTKIDHRNNKTLDNKFSNLRAATDLENGQNKLVTKNSLGYKGVSKVKGASKFQASICVDYKSIYLGSFNTPEQAYAAYCEAAVKYHGNFSNLRCPKAVQIKGN